MGEPRENNMTAASLISVQYSTDDLLMYVMDTSGLDRRTSLFHGGFCSCQKVCFFIQYCSLIKLSCFRGFDMEENLIRVYWLEFGNQMCLFTLK